MRFTPGDSILIRYLDEHSCGIAPFYTKSAHFIADRLTTRSDFPPAASPELVRFGLEGGEVRTKTLQRGWTEIAVSNISADAALRVAARAHGR